MIIRELVDDVKHTEMETRWHFPEDTEQYERQGQESSSSRLPHQQLLFKMEGPTAA